MDNLKLKPLAAILILGGLLVLWVLFRNSELPLTHETQTIDGVVVARYTRLVSNTVTSEPFLRIRLSIDGSEHTIERKVDEDYWNAHPPQTSVAIAMRGADLRSAKLHGASNDELLAWAKTGGSLLAIVLGLLVLGYDRWKR